MNVFIINEIKILRTIVWVRKTNFAIKGDIGGQSVTQKWDEEHQGSKTFTLRRIYT